MRQYQRYTILDAAAATGWGISTLVSDFRHKVLTVATAGMGAGDTIKVKVAGSVSEDAPTFSSAQSVSNQWDYVQIIDLEDGNTIDGDAGVTITEADDVKQFAINIDGLNWISVEVDTISDTSSTSVTSEIKLYND